MGDTEMKQIIGRYVNCNIPIVDCFISCPSFTDTVHPINIKITALIDTGA
jgi:hypothetical protein